MKGSKYCYGHDRLLAARTQDMELPPLEDANAIVLSLTKGLNAMMKGQMDLKSAGMFFYGMQIVASVMGRVRFGEPEENTHHGGTGDTEEIGGKIEKLPRISADESRIREKATAEGGGATRQSSTQRDSSKRCKI
jgi:hypothetical protein